LAYAAIWPDEAKPESLGHNLGIAIINFFGAFFLGVQTSPYFPFFVLFCMAYGAAATAYMMWPDRKAPRD